MKHSPFLSRLACPLRGRGGRCQTFTSLSNSLGRLSILSKILSSFLAQLIFWSSLPSRLFVWPSRYFRCNPFPIHDFWTWECTQVVADHNETQNEIIQAASITDHRGLVQRSSGTTWRSEYGLKVFKSMHRRPDQSHQCWTQSLPPNIVQVDSERTHVTITSPNNERCGRMNLFNESTPPNVSQNPNSHCPKTQIPNV